MHRKSAYILFLAVLGMLVIGIVMLFSTSAFARDSHGNIYFFIRRQAIWLGVGLALFAFLHHRGVGPFDASHVRAHRTATSSVVVTFSVTNQGSHTARSTCHITALDDSGSTVADESVLTPAVAPGSTIHVSHVLPIAMAAAARFQARCT